MIKKREIDIFGILLGIVIGCVLGFFLSKRIDINPPNENVNPVIAQPGNVFLLQVNRFDNANEAQAFLIGIKDKDLFAVCVYENNSYYIYGGISNTSEGLSDKKLIFESKGYSPLIKKEYILNKPNSVLENQNEYEFWEECIENFVKHLDGKSFVISAKYTGNPVDLDMFTCLTLLQTLSSQDLISRVRLQTYQTIIDNLG